MAYSARSLRSGDIKRDEEKNGTNRPLMATDTPTAIRRTNGRCIRYLCWGLGVTILFFVSLCVVGYHYYKLEEGADGNQNGIVKEGAAWTYVRIAMFSWKFVEGVYKRVEVFQWVSTVASGFCGWFQKLFSRENSTA